MRARRDPTSRAREAEAYAQRMYAKHPLSPARLLDPAWFVAADAWEEAGNIKRAELLRAVLPSIAKSQRVEFIRGVEDALWLPAWMTWMEDNGEDVPRNVTRETADPIPSSGRYLARRFATHLLRLNKQTLPQIWQTASLADEQPVDARELGYYLAMQALGHGVSWNDNHKTFRVILPSAETAANPTAHGQWVLDGYISGRFARALDR